MTSNTRHSYPGFFISVDGPDGTGKSTLTKRLHDYLAHYRGAANVIWVSDPRGTVFGTDLFERYIKHYGNYSQNTIALLFAAARQELVDTLIKPALLAGKIVISDRFIDSTVAYQGFGSGLREFTDKLLTLTPDIVPDVTFLLDAPLEILKARIESRGEKVAFDKEKEDFVRRMIDGYQHQFRHSPKRIKLIDASKTEDQVFMAITHQLMACFPHVRR